MNEKIKELAEQAYEQKQNMVIDPKTYEMVPGKTYRKELNVQKFAELIVRECMSEIQRVRQIKVGNAGPVYNQAFDDGMFVAIGTIEEHFGIEEEPEIVEHCPTCNEPWSGTSCGLNDCGWVNRDKE
jgi:hypothetical protein